MFLRADEFYTVDLMQIRVKKLRRKIDLDLKFQGQNFLSFSCILVITNEDETFSKKL